ncbi:hypothetical protein [Calothrix sp. NIES-3974]|uniref:hypothetical protein n=1 Tax=Calothrix sp. NIES-3974 TaxID=2005462 RepID=UPI000B5EFD77|nr:hypothetical protein [Calothrix sp. NIES-3974]BAZ05960.1 hypothetical protein NIES3974_26170 [Calothrix sp. NIES-3974]
MSEEGAGVEDAHRHTKSRTTKCKTLAWRSQICGIERLATAESFALCTPTGSGKTRIAELAILQRRPDFLNTYDFTLDVESRIVSSKVYV